MSLTSRSPSGAQLADVRVGAHHHAEVAEERAHATDAVRALAIDDVRVALARTTGVGWNGSRMLRERHRARAGAAAAVRRGERLVQVELHHVDAHVARARAAQDGVHVRAVAVHQAAPLVDQLARAAACALSYSPSVFGLVIISAGDVAAGCIDAREQRLGLDDAARPGRERHGLEAVERAARRVRAVRAVGNEHLARRAALRLVVRADHHQTR